MESDGDRQPGKDEIRRVVQRETDTLAIAEGTLDKQGSSADRAFADQKHHEAGDEKGNDEIDERNDAVVDPAGQFCIGRAHSAAS